MFIRVIVSESVNPHTHTVMCICCWTPYKLPQREERKTAERTEEKAVCDETQIRSPASLLHFEDSAGASERFNLSTENNRSRTGKHSTNIHLTNPAIIKPP